MEWRETFAKQTIDFSTSLINNDRAMFTGIIQEVGTVQTVTTRDEILELRIEASNIIANKKKGDSIAIDGACLTITDLQPGSFTVEAIPETKGKTIIGQYKEGTKVNLEPSLLVGDSLDGHFVSGHVDFVGEITAVTSYKNSKVLNIRIPEPMKKFFALKGSVTINGVSLTISDISANNVAVSLIPETLKKTNLDLLQKGDTVNVEIDIISRYLDSLLQGKEKEASYEFLKERGFL